MEALFLIRRGGSANRQTARQILNELVVRADADMNDRMLLAKLEDEEGRASRPAAVRRPGCAQNPSAEHLAAYADFLLRQGPLEEADVQIRRLEKLSADDPAAWRSAFAGCTRSTATARSAPWSKPPPGCRQKASAASSADKARQCMTIGALYELCEQYAAAERWYRRLLEAQPDSFRTAGDRARQAETGRRCGTSMSRRGEACPVIRGRHGPLHHAGHGPDRRERFPGRPVAGRRGRERRPGPQFLAMLAAVRIVQDRSDEAIALYQRALAAEPQNIRTMNNLATLLGEQPGTAKKRSNSSIGPLTWPVRKAGCWKRKARSCSTTVASTNAIAMLKEAAASAEPDPRCCCTWPRPIAWRAGGIRPARPSTMPEERNLPQQLLTPADRKLVKELNRMRL